MSDPKLQRALRDHYGTQSMRPETLARLVDARAPSRRALMWSAAGVAAAMFLGFGVLALTTSGPAIADVVAREVAQGHKNNYAPDVKLPFFGICGAMDKLEFPLCDPATLVKGCETKGARYCSIQGRPAAQIKVLADGRRGTIYQCKDDSTFDTIESGEERIVDGVKVRLVRENGLLICVATDVTVR